MLPFALSTPCAAVLGGILGDRFGLPPIFYGLTGASLQVIGFGLLSALPEKQSIAPSTYGYLALAGFGCGAVYQAVVILIPLAVGRRDSGKQPRRACNYFGKIY